MLRTIASATLVCSASNPFKLCSDLLPFVYEIQYCAGARNPDHALFEGNLSCLGWHLPS